MGSNPVYATNLKSIIKMAKRRRMYVQSVEEKMMLRLKHEYKCTIKEAWNKLKLYNMQREMRAIKL